VISHPETLTPFNSESFAGFKEFLRIAFPSCLMICLETWNYQITGIMTGYLPEVQIESNSIVLNVSLFFYMFPFGLSVASSNLVGKFVGRFSVQATEYACKMSIIFTLICSLLVMILLLIVRPFLPLIYTDVEEEVNIIKDILLMYAFYEFFDFLTTSYAGMYRGLGMQNIIAFANFVCFYIISIPLCYLLTYPFEMEIYGTWTSYILAIICLVFFYSLIYVKKVDYYKICKESSKRLSHDSHKVDELNSRSNSQVNLIQKKMKVLTNTLIYLQTVTIIYNYLY